MDTTLTDRPVRKPAPLLFFRKFLRHGKRVACFAPSSRSLARAMCRDVDPNRPQTIVELGAGTGAVTRIAARRMHPESRLIALELDPIFCRELRRVCPTAEIICGDVAELPAQLDRAGVDQIDLLLNGLPTPSLPRSLNTTVLEQFQQRASRTAAFNQLTIMPWVYQPMYERLFEHVRFRLVVRNLPPGGVYRCERLRSDYRDRVPGA